MVVKQTLQAKKLFDYTLPLLIALLIYIIAEEILYNAAEEGGWPVWLVSLLVASGILIIFMAKRKYMRFGTKSTSSHLIDVGLFGFMILAFFVFVDDMINNLSASGDFGRWEIAVIFLIGLIVAGLVRYLGRRDKLISNVANNM